MDGDEERSKLLPKFTLRFIAAVSFLSFLYSCFSSYSNNDNNVQLSTLVLSLFAHSLDRKYMFFICNAIVAFLVKNLTFTSSSSNNTAHSSVTQLVETTASSVEYGISSVEYGIGRKEIMEKQEEGMNGDDVDVEEERSVETKVEDREDDVEVEEKRSIEKKAEDEEEGEEVEEKEGDGEEMEVKEASVSTEELNHKFEEFIRKMKEEIRIEALQQQQLVAAS